jgi:hypothetical protein
MMMMARVFDLVCCGGGVMCTRMFLSCKNCCISGSSWRRKIVKDQPNS